MIVEIESIYGDSLITGKKCTAGKLREMFSEALNLTDGTNFKAQFCLMYQFDELPFSEDVKSDFVIDLDTHTVYEPQY